MAMLTACCVEQIGESNIQRALGGFAATIDVEPWLGIDVVVRLSGHRLVKEDLEIAAEHRPLFPPHRSCCTSTRPA